MKKSLLSAFIGFHHFKFMVSDLDRSIAFYRNQLEMDVLYQTERYNLPVYNRLLGYESVHLKIAMLQYKQNPIQLALIEYINPPKKIREQELYYVGSGSFAIQVQNIQEQYLKLIKNGVSFTGEPVDIVREGRLVAHAAYLFDPDKIWIELYELPES